MTYHIVGLDFSLTETGIAIIRPETDDPITVDITGTPAVKNDDPAKYPLTLARLRKLAGAIVRKAQVGMQDGDVMIAVIEAPIFGKAMGQFHTRAGLWWLCYHLLEKMSLVVIVEPSKLKRYVTRKGGAPKELVFSTMVRNFPTVDIVNDNEADALGLACMAARELGFPQEPSVQRCDPGALEGVPWPEPIARRARALRGSP